MGTTDIKATLERLFSGKIDMSDKDSLPAKEKEDAFLSRALVAYAIDVLADTDLTTAAQSVVDGFNDNGLDAVFYKGTEATLWVVQAKWSLKGTASPDLGDVKKFTGGIRHLTNCEWTRFNEKVQEKAAELEPAIDDAHLTFRKMDNFGSLSETRFSLGTL